MTSAAEKLTTTLSTKGQLILPAEIRRRHKWDAGTKLVLEDTADGVLLKQAPAFPPATMDDVFGALPHGGPPFSMEEMRAAIGAEMKRRHARGRY